MLMVIFGAGASYDSVNEELVEMKDVWHRPPLANELFDQRFDEALRRFPRVVPLIRPLRGIREGTTVEEQLEEFQAQAEYYPPRRKQLLAARFYLQQVLYDCGREWHNGATQVTNYVALVDRLDMWRSQRNEPVCLVTFNYDLMLESALGVFRIWFPNINDYVLNDSYRLFKVHGSVDWVHPISFSDRRSPQLGTSDRERRRRDHQ